MVRHGGGPGAGPVVLSAALAAHAPAPWVVSGPEGLRLVEETVDADRFEALVIEAETVSQLA